MSVETFARDLWEALRQDLREQIGGLIAVEDFDAQVPPWEGLSDQVRHDKVSAVRSDLLRPILRAGYEVRKKI